MSADAREVGARQLVGARLRQLRLHANRTQKEAATAIEASIAKISQMENGRVPFRRRDLIDLLMLYGVTDPYQQETIISVALGKRDPDWWDSQDVPIEETVLWAHEQAATLIRTYQPHLVPDLLRTQEYAAAAHRASHYPAPSATATAATVKNVQRRQQALSASLWVVIDEPVLWRPLGGDIAAHLRQLDALTDASQTQGITIQVNPLSSPFLPACEPFTVFRFADRPQLLAIHRLTGDEISALRDAERYGMVFEELIAVAAASRSTPQIIARIRDHLHETAADHSGP
ncbi:helix-turn-helix transcriptional regulator [Nonomuraea sp. NPDC005650]|uniref:helix-turn-helix domain-containing protein n=1 Tax=Nonomuraea sp. NPDC005650 TaxID=3157045 RepID=UPI00339EECB2